MMQPTTPAPQPQPQPQPQPGQDQTKRQVDLMVGYGRQFLHEQAADQVLETIQEAETPEDGIGVALGELMLTMATDAAEKGQPVNDPMVMQEATKVLASDLAELAAASGAVEVKDQAQATRLASMGFAKAVEHFYRRAGKGQPSGR